MKLLKCLVHLDDAHSYVEKDVEIPSMRDRQGTVNHNHQKIVVEYAGKVPNNGPITFKEVKPTEDQMWLL